MTKDELFKLADMVEDGETSYELEKAIGTALLCDDELDPGVVSALSGSLNAAKALHDAVLSGWEFLIHNNSVAVGNPLEAAPEWASASTTSAAWVAAILRAKAQEIEK